MLLYRSNGEKYTNSYDLKLDDLVEHGLLTKSQMIVSFSGELSEYNLINNHAYTLVDMQDNLVKLYDPYGKTLFVSKNTFFDHLATFEICYFNNNLFKIPVIKTFLEFTDSWPALKFYEKVHLIEYDLIVEEDDTEVLINTIVKPDSKVLTSCCIYTEPYKYSTVEINNCSFRANLNSGKHKILVVLTAQNKVESCELCSKYLENGGSEFRFRLAASKKCSINKTVNEKLKYFLTGLMKKLTFF